VTFFLDRQPHFCYIRFVKKAQRRSLALSTKTKYDVWFDSPFINDLTEKYNVKFPEIVDIRCFMFHKKFKENHPDRWNKFLAAYKKVVESDEYKAHTKKIGTAAETEFRNREKAWRL